MSRIFFLSPNLSHPKKYNRKTLPPSRSSIVRLLCERRWALRSAESEPSSMVQRASDRLARFEFGGGTDGIVPSRRALLGSKRNGRWHRSSRHASPSEPILALSHFRLFYYSAGVLRHPSSDSIRATIGNVGSLMTNDEFFAELRLGAAEVRARLATKVYLGAQAALAHSWLERAQRSFKRGATFTRPSSKHRRP